MKNLVLSGRIEEISDNLQRKIAQAVLNAVLAKAYENGMIHEEVSLYLNEKDFNDFQEKYPVYKVERKKKSFQKNTKVEERKVRKEISDRIKKEESNEELFLGFED